MPSKTTEGLLKSVFKEVEIITDIDTDNPQNISNAALINTMKHLAKAIGSLASIISKNVGNNLR